MEKTATTIKHALSGKKPGEIVFASDFRGMGAETAIRKSLSRLTQQGKLRRVAQGVYYMPKVHSLLGELLPSAEHVAQKVAQKEQVRIVPSGVDALNKLGLSTQVPTQIVYLTDGVPRILTVGKTKVRFKATTPKKLALRGAISKLVVLALDELDTHQLDLERDEKLCQLLLQEDREDLLHDLRLTSGRIHDYIIKLINNAPLDTAAKADR